MEGSESEAIFESMNLNPQLFLNEVFNIVDDLTHDAFHFFQLEASKVVNADGTDRSEDLKKGVASIRNIVRSDLGRRLKLWEKYCLQNCFRLPEGFSLPKSELPGGSLKVIDALNDPEVDLQLDSLRNKLRLVGEETAELRRELQALERQSVLSNRYTVTVNEALQLYEQQSMPDMFQEMVRTASELRTKMENLRTKRREDAECLPIERKEMPNADMFRMTHSDGPFNATLEDLQEFINHVKPV